MEGEYSGLEHEAIKGIVESLKIVTRENIERIARFAYDYAITYNRKKVTAVHKANIQKLSDGLFLKGTRGRGTEIAGKDIGNPTSFIRASVDMLKYLGLDGYANLISDSLFMALTVRRIHTADVGGMFVCYFFLTKKILAGYASLYVSFIKMYWFVI
ncbi:unnamed protein product [Gongylonema pulchrum]|uniref:Iso_dh domain-containing protein n=1 Tax=Gongylonema pulchrum TaxID=637853 RepID=A0A183EEC2_9BILA|nr:unnamed protein product [Gongylonema pulchrum]